jgi:hypothetical protein
MSICAIIAAIKFGPGLGVVWTSVFVMIALASLVVQKVTIDTANRFTAASQKYIDEGMRIAVEKRRLVDQKFFRSCQPIRWSIIVVPVTETLFGNILDAVIVAKVVDFLLLIESG